MDSMLWNAFLHFIFCIFFSVRPPSVWYTGTVNQSAKEDNGANETGVLDDALGLRPLDPPGVRFLGHAPAVKQQKQ